MTTPKHYRNTPSNEIINSPHKGVKSIKKKFIKYHKILKYYENQRHALELVTLYLPLIARFRSVGG